VRVIIVQRSRLAVTAEIATPPPINSSHTRVGAGGV